MKEKIAAKLHEFFLLYNQNFDSQTHHSLYSGQSGQLLFRLYYQSYLDEENTQLESDLIEFITNQISGVSTRPTFANGITGFAWFLQHLHNQEFIELDEDVLGRFDDLIVSFAKTEMRQNNHDFMHGALGDMVYLLERISSKPSLKNDLLELFFLLEETGVKSDHGIAWTEDSDYLEGEEDCRIINFHISHGQASKILVMTKMLQNGMLEVQSVLKEAISFMLSNQDSKTGLIPSRLVDDNKEVKTHSGWCRSNIAIGLALYQASQVLNDDELARKAIDIGLNTIDMNRQTIQMPYDATFCHGKVGISHMYSRYFEYTQINAFKLAAEQWMEFTLESATFEDGIAGFKSWDSSKSEWGNKYGLLTGSAGIGLGLLAYLSESPVHSSWDSCLLLS